VSSLGFLQRCITVGPIHPILHTHRRKGNVLENVLKNNAVKGFLEAERIGFESEARVLERNLDI
jgi:hypothetical protein